MTRALLSTTQVGDVNRSRVLQALVDRGPLSRADLAAYTGATRATVSNIVQGLIDAGLVEELERRDTGKVGKPAAPVWFAPMAALSAAVAIAEGRAEAALVDARGDIIASAETRFDPRSDSPVLGSMTADLIGRLSIPKGRSLLGIGVAVPGVCDTDSGSVLGSGQLPGLTGNRLSRSLERRFSTRVVIDNDSRAQALGEKWFGLGRGVEAFAAVQTGEGLGVGLVLGGVVYRGERGETGEIGHTSVVADGIRCRCGLAGCWETVATLRWLRHEAARLKVPGGRAVDAGAPGHPGVRLAGRPQFSTCTPTTWPSGWPTSSSSSGRSE